MQAPKRVYILIVALLAFINLNAQVELNTQFPISDFGEQTLYKYQNDLFVLGKKRKSEFQPIERAIVAKNTCGKSVR